ncbi:MAG: hypothetical protein K6E16_09445 [Lachnospiraceae bacterium]|nr:hypothetical protein [Lachnospiraceae bacterium]
MKKRGMALILAGVLTASTLCACGSDSGKDAAATATPTTAAAPTEAAPTEAPDAEPDDVPDETDDEEEEAEDFSAIAGGWYYQLADQDDQTQFTSIGVVEIEEDGSYIYTANEGDERSGGTIRSGYEEFADGSQIPTLEFYDNGGNFWIGCYVSEDDPDNLWIGNGGMERLTRGGHGSPQEGQGRNEFIGTYTEPKTGRCVITMDTEDGINYTVSIRWAGSAYESANWEIKKAVYGESSGELEYSGAKFYVRTFTDETNYTDDVRYSNGTGRFWFDQDGMLCWVSDNSDLDEYDGQTLFEKLPE